MAKQADVAKSDEPLLTHRVLQSPKPVVRGLFTLTVSILWS